MEDAATGLKSKAPLRASLAKLSELIRLRGLRKVAAVAVFMLIVTRWLLGALIQYNTLSAMKSIGVGGVKLTLEELSHLLKVNGVNLHAEQLHQWVAPLDGDRDNKFDVDEIGNVASHFDELPQATSLLRSIGFQTHLMFWLDFLFSIMLASGIIFLLCHSPDQQDIRLRLALLTRNALASVREKASVSEIEKLKDEIQSKEHRLRVQTRSLLNRDIRIKHMEQEIRVQASTQEQEQQKKESLEQELEQKQRQLAALTERANKPEHIDSMRQHQNSDVVQVLYFYYASPLIVRQGIGSAHIDQIQAIDERNRVTKELHRGCSDADKSAEKPIVHTGLAVSTGQTLINVLRHLKTQAGAVLHLSLHGGMPNEQDSTPSLLLEDARGAGEWMDSNRLKLILNLSGGCQGLDLCFLNCCYGERFGEEFIRSGCRYVVCLKTHEKVRDSTARLFADSFYYCLGTGLAVPDAFQNAVNSLRARGESSLCEEAERYVLLKQSTNTLVEPQVLPSVATEELGRSISTPDTLLSHAPNPALLCRTPSAPNPERMMEEDKQPQLQRSISDENRLFGVSGLVQEAPPAGLEDFVGRGNDLAQVLGLFCAKRKCVCIHGPSAIGKSSFLKKLVHFSDHPGRTFADAAISIDCAGCSLHLSIGRLVEAVKDKIKTVSNQIQDVGQNVDGAFDFVEEQEADSEVLMSKAEPPHLSELLRKLRELHNCRRSSQRLVLLAFDGLTQSQENTNMLEGILAHCHWLYIATAAAAPWTSDLLDYKVVPYPLGGLEARASAQLLLKRARRPLRETDFVLADVSASSVGGHRSKVLASSEELIEQLAKHPVLIATYGNPGKIRQLAQRVTPELHSLYDLLSLDTAQ